MIRSSTMGEEVKVEDKEELELVTKRSRVCE
jgi:hypothetical protein